ncbi:MAG: nucleotidyltransferase [Kiritimatiellae bacterium]|nr:nucleotidyltransferase [Kiritimatiellia bacterium]
MKKTLVVLAAGIGSRYGGLKQMDPVGPSGEFILDYSVYDAIKAGFNKIVFVISKNIENDFKETIGKRISAQVEVDYVIQSLEDLPKEFSIPTDRTKPWGTGHAVFACRNAVNEPFAVINGDDFYGQESYKLLANSLEASKDDPAIFAMVGYKLSNTVSEHGSVARGVCSVDEDSKLTTVVERTHIETDDGNIRYKDDDGSWHDLSGNELVSMNLWGFKPSLFATLETEFLKFLQESGNELKSEFFVPSVVNTLINANAISVDVLATSSPWFGVTYAADKPIVVAKIQKLIDEGLYPSSLWD